MRGFWLTLLLTAAALAGAQSPTPAGPPWRMLNSGTTAGLRGVFSVDGAVAWVSGTGGTVLETSDGGEHWRKCAVPDAISDGATLDFRGVRAWDARTALVMASGPGTKSRLYKTVDGCKTWKLVFGNPDQDGFWDAFSASGDKISILGDPVAGSFTMEDSEDGGRRWKSEKLPPSLRSEGAFAASNSALFADWKDGIELFGTGGPGGVRIFTRCDPCTKRPFDRDRWFVQPLPVFGRGESAGIFSVAGRLSGAARRSGPSAVYVAVGGDYSKPDEAGAAAYSRKWLGWTASAQPPHGYRSSVQWSKVLHAWIAAGTNGSDISRDEGKTWQPVDDGNWNALSLPFVVGPRGRIARLNPAAFRSGEPGGSEDSAKPAPAR